jgi:hypothetical protein
MSTALIVLQVVAAALSAIVALHKPAPRPAVTVTDKQGGGITIAISCPVGYDLRYPGVTALPVTDAERINDANRAVCKKAAKPKAAALPKPAPQPVPVPQG